MDRKKVKDAVKYARYQTSGFESKIFDELNKLTIVEDDKLPHVLSASRMEIKYNPKLVENTSEDDLLSLMLHEGMHRIMKHQERGSRVIQLFDMESIIVNTNIAYDLEANEILLDRWGIRIEDAYYPGQEPFENYPPGKSGEHYFAMMLAQVVDTLAMAGESKKTTKGDQEGRPVARSVRGTGLKGIFKIILDCFRVKQ